MTNEIKFLNKKFFYIGKCRRFIKDSVFMEKINPISFNSAEYGKIKKDEPTESNDNISVNELPKNSLEEAIGRSQVNFRGADLFLQGMRQSLLLP